MAVDPRQLELPMVGKSGAVVRAAKIVQSLPELSSEGVFAAFEELDALPPDVVRAALSPVTGPAPDPDSLDDATRRAHGFPPRPLRLRTLAVVKDADIFDLGTVAEEQLRVAGMTWDGRDLSAEERLDGELEGSFASTLEHHCLADAEQPGDVPLFDVLLYAGEAGAIFRSGTTELVGAIAGETVEMKDRRARIAIQQALAPSLRRSQTAQVESEVITAPKAKKRSRAALAKKTAAAKKTPTSAKKAASAKKTATAKKTASAKKTATAKKTSTAKKSAAAKESPTAAKKKASAKKTAAAKEPSVKKATKNSSAAKTSATTTKSTPKD